MKCSIWTPGLLGIFAALGCSTAPATSMVGTAAGSSTTPSPAMGGSAPASTGGAAGSDPGLVIDVVPPAETAGTASGGAPIMLTDLVATEVGGYQRGDEILPGGATTPSAVEGNDGCGVIVGVVRDFQTMEPDRHPDFEVFSGTTATKGLVAPELDANRKPVYASQCEANPDTTLCPMGQQTTGQANFDQWYRDTPGVNRSYLLYFQLKPVGNIVSFQSENFVPMDDAGFNDTYVGLDGLAHNYGFTTAPTPSRSTTTRPSWAWSKATSIRSSCSTPNATPPARTSASTPPCRWSTAAASRS
jgi:hypothetical protein